MDGPGSLADLVDEWVRSRGDSPYACETRDRLARLLLKRRWIQPEDVTVHELERWNVDSGGRGLETPGDLVPRLWRTLRTVLLWGVERYRVAADPDALVVRLRAPRKAKSRLLYDWEVEAIREESGRYGERAAAVVDYLLSYGARPKTACELRLLRDLDLGGDPPRLTIERAKKSGGWTHPLVSEQAELWASFAPPSASADWPLFPHYKEDRSWRIRNGKASEIADWYKGTIGKRLGLHAAGVGTIYRLKDWAMTRLLRILHNPEAVCNFSGHLDKRQVLVYDVTNDEQMAAALDEIRLDPELLTIDEEQAEVWREWEALRERQRLLDERAAAAPKSAHIAHKKAPPGLRPTKRAKPAKQAV